jgi:antitoxin CptB
LLWHCRRGTKELDVLLERFVQLHYVSASADERRAFERLISLPDPDLADYLFGYAPPAAGLEDIVARVAGTAPSAQPGGALDASDNC